MAITNYTELKSAVANWLARDNLTSYIPDFITLGEARIYRDLRIREMETALSETISSGVIAVPTGYLEMKNLYLSTSSAISLGRSSTEWIYGQYPTRSADSEPRFFAREGSNFIFGPYPDSAYTVKGIYYKKLDNLSDSNTTNWLTTSAQDLILFASLLEAEPFIKNDDRLILWESKYQNSRNAIQKQDNRECGSGSQLQMTPG